MRHQPTQGELQAIASLTLVCNFRELVRMTYDVVNQVCASRNYHPQVVYGARNARQQYALWAKGRRQTNTMPLPYGQWEVVGPVVTRALPEQSAHCWAAAADIALIDDVAHGWLADAHPAWEELVAKTAEKFGLDSGYRFQHFRDAAHVQLPDWEYLAKTGKLGLVQ